MQGTITQVIALVTHGNGYFGGVIPAQTDGFYPANSTFRFCEYVKFVAMKTNGTEWRAFPYADDPLAWMAQLKTEGVTELRVRYMPSGGQKLGNRTVPDYQLVGFIGGGGRWIIDAVKNSGVDHWEARWQVGDKEQKEKRIWHVTYGRIAYNQEASAPDTVDLEDLKVRLGKHLQLIASFARTKQLDDFAQAFERGLVCLSSSTSSEKLYHDDMAPPGALPQTGTQLLDAVQAAWVFGGMGSWNDLGFESEDQKTYEQLSADLYSLFIRAIVSATNTAASSTPSKNRRWWPW